MSLASPHLLNILPDSQTSREYTYFFGILVLVARQEITQSANCWPHIWQFYFNYSVLFDKNFLL